MLDEVGLHQVVEDVILMNPLHRAAAGGAKRRALHPAGVAGSTKDVHARLQAEAKTRGSEINLHCTVKHENMKVSSPWAWTSVWMTRSMWSYLTQSCSRSWQITHVRVSSILSVLVPSTGGLDKTLPALPLVEPTTSVREVCGKPGL